MGRSGERGLAEAGKVVDGVELVEGGLPAGDAGDVGASPTLTEDQRRLTRGNMGLVGVHLRRRVPTPRRPRRTREYEDLFQEGCIALMRAAARYDADEDGEFAAFALPRIRGAIHAALREKFCVVHTPIRDGQPVKVEGFGGESGRHTALRTFGVGESPGASASAETAPGWDTIRHAIHRRFQHAVRTAMDDLRGRSWRRRNPCSIMARIADERILIGSEAGRTPLRHIAREAGVSSSRVAAYEKHLIDVVSENFCRDAQLPLLVRFAGEDEAGFDGAIDDGRAAELSRAELDAFSARFDGMEPCERARVLFALLERSTEALGEVARNLYRMASEDEVEAA